MSELVTSNVQQAREYLVQRREEIRAMHRDGGTGSQIVAALTVSVDAVVDRITAVALQELGAATGVSFESRMALVALGGYGRAELAPYSDVDLMFLYEPPVRLLAESFWSRLVRDFWDARLILGSSMRTLKECITLAQQDPSIHSALLESRHVVGSHWLTVELQDHVSRLSRGRRRDRFIRTALHAREVEQAKSGSNVHLLEPDVKKSRGGLRDLHLMRWIAHARFGMAQLDRLENDNHLTAEDAGALREAREFLFRVRNELHFHAGRAQDNLTWDEQERLAGFFGYQSRPGMLAVEQFMQQYYRHTAAIDEITNRFVSSSLRPSIWSRLARPFVTQRIGHSYRIFGGQLRPAPETLAQALESIDRTLQLFWVANSRRVRVADDVRERIRAAVPRLSEQELPRARATFLRILSEPGKLTQTLHDLHSLGLLQKLIPEFAHARGLIQFNQYHKYTVDEHTLLCIANAEKLLQDKGPLGQVYRQIGAKDILHLALLLHDLGKGFDGDHSELGAAMAHDTAQRFELEPHLSDLLVFLVRHHLLMAHLAFRRDTSDAKLLADFARRAGTPEVLRMLFVLTAADIASVGPETWTTWKAEVLGDLYARTMESLSGQMPTLRPNERAAEVSSLLRRKLAGSVPGEWLDLHLPALTTTYLLTTPVDRIREDLSRIHMLPDGDVLTTTSYDAQTRITAYTVYTFDRITPGLFSKITGVLAAKGLHILSAQITTLTNGAVIDRFEVLDDDFAGEPPIARANDVRATIRQVLRGERSVDDVFSARIGPRYLSPASSTLEPTQVKFDNETSETSTIIEVFANDRQGLLYVIARTIFELGLSVSVAKIATSLDQVLDVFYVTDQTGSKVVDPEALEHIRNELVQAIESFSGVQR